MTVCIANIGPRQRRMRFVGGIVTLTGCVALMWALGSSSRLARLWVFLPLLLTSLLFLQVQARTCVALAARGQRDLDQGPARVDDDVELSAVRAQARQVAIRSVVIAALVTAVYLIV